MKKADLRDALIGLDVIPDDTARKEAKIALLSPAMRDANYVDEFKEVTDPEKRAKKIKFIVHPDKVKNLLAENQVYRDSENMELIGEILSNIEQGITIDSPLKRKELHLSYQEAALQQFSMNNATTSYYNSCYYHDLSAYNAQLNKREAELNKREVAFANQQRAFTREEFYAQPSAKRAKTDTTYPHHTNPRSKTPDVLQLCRFHPINGFDTFEAVIGGSAANPTSNSYQR